MMFARRNFPVPGKTPLQHFAVLHLGHVNQTPPRQPTAASFSDWMTK
jgi:hypothetical protein